MAFLRCEECGHVVDLDDAQCGYCRAERVVLTDTLPAVVNYAAESTWRSTFTCPAGTCPPDPDACLHWLD